MSRSLRVDPKYIQKVKLAAKFNSYPSQKALSIDVGLSLSTVKNFLNGQPVDYLNFVEISQKIGLDWREIAYIDIDVELDGEVANQHQESGEAVDARVRELSSERVALDQSQSNHSLPSRKENTVEKSHNIEANLIREWRFKSVDQLWSKDIGERISGIRKLERIAKDYPTEHWAIMEELAEFIRIKAPRKEGEEERSLKLRGDIQAALTVIGWRDPEKDKGVLDLSSTDLRGANLREAELQGINLSAAQLQGADFCEAKLQGAYLIKANLKEAQLVMANLEGAYVHQANLEEAKFLEAILRHTKLPEANLKKADFCNADLGFADLRKTNLEFAKFDCAKLTGAQLSQANLRETYLIGADLKGTNFSETDVELKQIEYAFGDSTTVLPNDVERPAHWM